MTEKKSINAFGTNESVTTLMGLVGGAGATEISVRYDRADGPPLEDGEKPGPDDAVLWTAVAQFPETHRHHPHMVGLFRVEPGGNHTLGMVNSLANLARELGANVTVVGG